MAMAKPMVVPYVPGQYRIGQALTMIKQAPDSELRYEEIRFLGDRYDAIYQAYFLVVSLVIVYGNFRPGKVNGQPNAAFDIHPKRVNIAMDLEARLVEAA